MFSSTLSPAFGRALWLIVALLFAAALAPHVERAARPLKLRPSSWEVPFDESSLRRLPGGVEEQLIVERRHDPVRRRVRVLRRAWGDAEHGPQVVYDSAPLRAVWIGWFWGCVAVIVYRRARQLPWVTPVGAAVALGVLAVGFSLA